MAKKLDYKKVTQPHYYTGNVYGYSAKDIIDDFGLNSWTSQAVQYILRSGKKEGSPPEQDIQKAINVLHFELDRLYKKSTIKTGGLVR
jgi:hypothetical protein